MYIGLGIQHSDETRKSGPNVAAFTYDDVMRLGIVPGARMVTPNALGLP